MGERLAIGIDNLFRDPAQVKEIEKRAKDLYAERFAIEVTMGKLLHSGQAEA
jgi:hypothetical protein